MEKSLNQASVLQHTYIYQVPHDVVRHHIIDGIETHNLLAMSFVSKRFQSYCKPFLDTLIAHHTTKPVMRNVYSPVHERRLKGRWPQQICFVAAQRGETSLVQWFVRVLRFSDIDRLIQTAEQARQFRLRMWLMEYKLSSSSSSPSWAPIDSDCKYCSPSPRDEYVTLAERSFSLAHQDEKRIIHLSPSSPSSQQDTGSAAASSSLSPQPTNLPPSSANTTVSSSTPSALSSSRSPQDEAAVNLRQAFTSGDAKKVEILLRENPTLATMPLHPIHKYRHLHLCSMLGTPECLLACLKSYADSSEVSHSTSFFFSSKSNQPHPAYLLPSYVLNMVDRYVFPATYYAVAFDRLEIFRTLRSAGAEIDPDFRLPLLSIAAANDSVELVTELLPIVLNQGRIKNGLLVDALRTSIISARSKVIPPIISALRLLDVLSPQMLNNLLAQVVEYGSEMTVMTLHTCVPDMFHVDFPPHLLPTLCLREKRFVKRVLHLFMREQEQKSNLWERLAVAAVGTPTEAWVRGFIPKV